MVFDVCRVFWITCEAKIFPVVESSQPGTTIGKFFSAAANNHELDFTQQWKREYDLVENAIFTDPSDQSAWFYHKWLTSTHYGQHMKHLPQMSAHTSVKINRLVINMKECQLIVGLSRPLRHKPLITVAINDRFLTQIQWNSIEGQSSDIWFTSFNQLSAEELKQIAITPIPTFAINPESIERFEVSLTQTNGKQLFVWERKTTHSDKQITLEDSYLKTLRELHKLEPNNKCESIL